MKIKFDVKGLKFQNWLNMMVFSLLILVVLWALQFLFLNSFYKSMKISEIKSIGNKISDHFGDNNFFSIMSEYAFQNNLRVIMLEESGIILGSFDGFSGEMPIGPQEGYGVFPRNDFAKVIEKIKENGSDRIAFLNENSNSGFSQAVFAAKVTHANSQNYYLYISSPIPAIDSTVSVLKTQFVIITVILFVLSLVTAQMISKKMAAPIISLTESAERLVRGELCENNYEDGFTEINRLASAMNYAAGELRSLDNFRKEFIANVSHDLKTPLTIIKFYGEMIRDVSGEDPEKRIAHCEQIIHEADWLTDMVGEILEVSKLEAAGNEAAAAEMNLSGVLREILAGFHVFCEKSGYQLASDIDEDLKVFGNEPMLRRVLYNLISNAVNFTGADKRVFVSLKAAGQKARFEVTDTGEGIAKEKQRDIWDRYYKGGDVHKRAVIGTGLGLSIVKNALGLHKADFGVESEHGKGSTFWFEMKLITES